LLELLVVVSRGLDAVWYFAADGKPTGAEYWCVCHCSSYACDHVRQLSWSGRHASQTE